MHPQDTIPEAWRPVTIATFADYYDVSNLGRVRRHTSGRLLASYPQWHGYLLVKLHATGIYRAFSIHRLVAMAFLGPVPENHEVNHIDGDKRNNWANNLEYVTRRENLADADRRGLTRRGMLNGHTNLTNDDVRAIRARSAKASVLAARHHTTVNVVYMIWQGRTWKHLL